MKDPLDNRTGDAFVAKIAEIAETSELAWKVTYQFVGNNHSLRSNTLVFFCADATRAAELAEKFLSENNIRYLKVISTTKA